MLPWLDGATSSRIRPTKDVQLRPLAQDPSVLILGGSWNLKPTYTWADNPAHGLLNGLTCVACKVIGPAVSSY